MTQIQHRNAKEEQLSRPKVKSRGLDSWSAESGIEGSDYAWSPLALMRRLVEQMDRFVTTAW
jgi:hypothetical protein